MRACRIRSLFFVVFVLCMSAVSFAQVGLEITIAPPPLPVYEQPVCPGDGYIWTPGYWAWDSDFDDYYWVPGTWVLAPEVGSLWTPPYWGWGGNGFIFYPGYWGPQIGFYGGINYGYGYFGNGYWGGRWDHGHFFYNRSVTNINVTNIHNVYDTRVNNPGINHVSYNGGHGGIDTRPTPEQEAAAHERHIPPVEAQTKHMQEARSNPQQRASVNMGRPSIAATEKPNDFKGRGVVPAREAGAPYTPPNRSNTNAARTNTATHVKDLPPLERPTSPNTGNAKLDKKYQQQQEKQYSKQQQERQKLAQQQQKEDQRMAKQNVQETQRQQMEQRHQQQTMQMQQRQQQEQKQMQQRMQPQSHAAPESHGGTEHH